MRYGKIIICFLTVAFLAVAVFFGLQDPVPEISPAADAEALFSVLISSGDETEQIDCWKNDAREYFVFLPSYAELSQVQVRIENGSVIRIGGRLLENGMSCGDFRWDVPYELSCNGDLSSVTFVRSGNVPALYIDVQSHSMDFIHTAKDNEESGWLRLYTAEGELNHTGRLESISTRGNSTWDYEKKPYNLELPGEGDLLGMGQAQNWVLLSNATDPSQLRNKIVYDFADAAGLAYSPDSKWVDLYLNGEYAGLYLLCERNEVHPQRVDLAQTGSFLVSMESGFRLTSQGYPHITTQSGVALRVHHTAVSTASLTEAWQSAENAILAEDGIDPVTGKHWTELIDLDSWARKYLIEEIFGNLDAGSISQFFYRDGTGRICAGPVWDYDYALGSSEVWQTKYPNAFFANKSQIWSAADSPWFYALYQKDAFFARVTELYETDFRPLLENLLDEGISRYAAQISQAAAVNQIRWPGREAAGETEHIRTYMTERMAFLNDVWLEDGEYCTVLVNLNDGFTSTACYALRPGECVPELPEYEDSEWFLGWYNAETEEPFDITQPVYEGTELYLKTLPTEPDRISPLQAVPIAAVAVILISVFLIDKRRAKKNTVQPGSRAEV